MSSSESESGSKSRHTRPSPRIVDHEQHAQSTVHVGERLRQLRLQQGLTQEQAAKAAGITRNALIGLERHRFPNPYLSTLLALMHCFGLSSLDELLGRSPADTVYNAWKTTGWINTRRAGDDTRPRSDM